MTSFHPRIVCCYLYPITRYGYPPKASHTARYMKEMAALGFTSVELEGIREPHLLEVAGITDEIKHAAESLTLGIPYFCAVLPGLSSHDEKIRQHNLELFETGCRVASTIGAIGILDNGPLPPFEFPDDVPVSRHFDEDILRNAKLPSRLNWQMYYDSLAETYKTACQIAAGYKLTYQLHPCLGVLTSTTAGFLRFAEKVNEDNLRFNFDTANLFAANENLLISLHQVIQYVDYIHISDNRGTRIEHLPTGDGAIDWDSFFTLLHENNYEGSYGIDIGGSETEIESLDDAYLRSASFISGYL